MSHFDPARPLRRALAFFLAGFVLAQPALAG